MRVALVRAPEVHAYWNARRPLLGISTIAAYLESKGIECKIFDANFNSWDEDDVVRRVLDYRPGLVGLSSMTHEIVKSHQIAKKISASLPEIPVVIGGCHATAIPKETLQDFPAFHIAVIGEGEKTLYEIIEMFKSGNSGDLAKVSGLAFRSPRGEITITPPRDRMSSEELDQLPYPALQHYYDRPNALAGKDDLYVILTSRGCPYRCSFCMQVMGHQVRRRSAQSILREIETAVQRYGAHTIHFADEIFLFNDEHTYEVLDLIIKTGLNKKIRWRSCSRVNLVNDRLIQKAKEAGCFALELGIESGNDQVLKNVQKGITVHQIKSAVSIIKKYGISVEANFILGHPNETRETIDQTIDLAVTLNPNTIAVGIMTPYPGTEIYEMAMKGEGGYRLLSKDWSQYDKYGGKSLEMKDITIKELEGYQRKALMLFYLKNLRFFDLMKFGLQHRKIIFRLLFKKV